MKTLAELFAQFGRVPTRSEYTHILRYIHYHVRTPDRLRHGIYGWTEGVEHWLLYAPELDGTLNRIMAAGPTGLAARPSRASILCSAQR